MKTIDKLILCSPYKEPHLHWDRNPINQEFYKREGRRPAGYTVATKSKSSIQTGLFKELKMVNKIREHVKRWQEEGRRGLTPVSRGLLEFWYDDTQRQYPFFFCQLEAIETIIFMAEAPDDYKTGIEIESDGGDFTRWCSKMATGSGKTIIMSMVIAWNILNQSAYPKDKRFSKNILVVAPGLTVKNRLAVLQPEDENNYFKEFNIVPNTQMDKLRQGKVLIINWHKLAWDTQEKLDKRVEKGYLRSVDKRSQMEISDKAYAKEVLGDMADAKNILVLNDEAHHAWRTPSESKQKGKTAAEIDNTIWIGGLDKLHKEVGILRCHDLSATPFAPSGKKSSEQGLFKWIISDFGLNDAIESGLVKTPRVVIRDDGKLTSDYKSKLYHLYEDKEVKADLNQSRISAATPLPDLLKNAYNLLGADWLQTKREWQKQGMKIPPVMITVANKTETSDRIKYYFDAALCEVKELCEADKTLQIDSRILGKVENEDSNLSGSLKKQAEELRNKVDSVGKIGKPGEQIQNVISVAMLSEGWDAKNVTHIMGLRAFSSQLLCEQVVGRGLRRVSYEFDEDKMLAPEYVNIFGVPFSFIPHEGGGTSPRPPKLKYQIEPVEMKSDYLITFPNILRVDTVYQSKLEIDYNQLQSITINPEDTITKADLTGVIQGEHTPIAMTEIDLKNFAEQYRLQSVIFKVAATLFEVEKNNWQGNQFDFLAQIFKLTEEFLASDKIHITSNLFAKDKIRRNILLTLNISRIIQHFQVAIKKQNIAELSPIFDSEQPLRSTVDIPTWYSSKPNTWHNRSHVNYTVFDSTWEANNANILDKHELVKAFIKNDHLGFVIKYNYKGIVKNYLPDYIVELTNGDKLVLEVKGQDSDENRVKRSFLDIWVKAVNGTKRFGNWHWAVVFNSSELYDVLEKYKEFPTEAFTPQEENPTQETLLAQSEAVAKYFDLSVEELQKEKSVDKMIEKVIKYLLESNIEDIFNTIKEAANTSEEDFVDIDQFQELIYNKLDGLTPTDTKIYNARVRGWFSPAKWLNRQSLSYLISAEFLLDSLIKQRQTDFSPVVLQLSRAVESEFLLKIFIPFTNWARTEYPNIATAFPDDLEDADTGLFAKMILRNRTNYTLGNMHAVLKMAGNPKMEEQSLLIQEFCEFIVENADRKLCQNSFLKDVTELLKRFRNKSAHVYDISIDQARECKFLVKGILTIFVKYTH